MWTVLYNGIDLVASFKCSSQHIKSPSNRMALHCDAYNYALYIGCID